MDSEHWTRSPSQLACRVEHVLVDMLGHSRAHNTEGGPSTHTKDSGNVSPLGPSRFREGAVPLHRATPGTSLWAMRRHEAAIMTLFSGLIQWA